MMRTPLRERPATSPNETAIRLVDDALRQLSQRELVTIGEAGALLRDIAAKIDDPVSAARAASVVDAAVTSYGDAVLVGSSRIVDALLDVRLILTD